MHQGFWPTALLLTCEHAGNRVPAAFAAAFAGEEAQRALVSHRGYDIGALQLAKALSRDLAVPLIACTVTRLLVETNRSPHHRALFSSFAMALSPQKRALAVTRYYVPHRARVAQAVAGLVSEGQRVLHIAVHSFTPWLAGQERAAEIGLLYDPRRESERRVCAFLQRNLHARLPKYRVRRNYPYRGAADGLTKALRLAHSQRAYVGVELEVNQRLLRGGAPRDLRQALTAALADVLRGAD